MNANVDSAASASAPTNGKRRNVLLLIAAIFIGLGVLWGMYWTLVLARAQADLVKREPLLAARAIAPEEVRHARESVELARAALTQAVRQSKSSHALVDGADVTDNPAVLQAKAAYRDAWIAAE